MSLSGDRALVGAHSDRGDCLSGANCGAAYVFERDSSGTWIEQQKLQATDRDHADFFGWSVSLSGNRALVGAIRDDGTCLSGTDCGAAYVFERTSSGSWVEQHKLQATDRDAGDDFGRSVSLSGDFALVGARADDGNCLSGADCGAAYIRNLLNRNRPSITSPVPDGNLGGAYVTFQWDNHGMNASSWELDVGNMRGGNDVYDSANLPANTRNHTVPYLPTDSSQVWVRLTYFDALNIPQHVDAVFAANRRVGFVWPNAGAQYASTALTVQFVSDNADAEWRVNAGTAPGDDTYLLDASEATQGVGLLTRTIQFTTTPPLGTTLYLTLFDSQGGTDTDYAAQAFTFTPHVVTPAHGSVLAGVSQSVTYTAGDIPVAQWAIYAGDAPRKFNYYYSGHLDAGVTNNAITGLPVDGSDVYTTLWHRAGPSGPFTPVDYVYKALLGPQISAPSAPGPLSGTSETLTINDNGTTVSQWALYAGDAPRKFNYFYSGHVTNTGDAQDITVSGLPLNGSDVHITLWYRPGLSGSFTPVDAVYTTLNGPTITSPPPPGPLAGTSQSLTFAKNDINVAQWAVYAGDAPRRFNYYYSGHVNDSGGAITSASLSGLPTDGSIVYVTVWYRTGTSGAFTPIDAVYTAFTGPQMTSPPNNGILSGPVTFSPGDATVGNWAVYVGSAPRAFDYYYSGHLSGSATGTTIPGLSGLPSNTTVYVTLWHRTGMSGPFTPIDYVYTVQ